METEKKLIFSAFSIFLSMLFLELYNNVLHNYIVQYRKGDYIYTLRTAYCKLNEFPSDYGYKLL